LCRGRARLPASFGDVSGDSGLGCRADSHAALMSFHRWTALSVFDGNVPPAPVSCQRLNRTQPCSTRLNHHRWSHASRSIQAAQSATPSEAATSTMSHSNDKLRPSRTFSSGDSAEGKVREMYYTWSPHQRQPVQWFEVEKRGEFRAGSRASSHVRYNPAQVAPQYNPVAPQYDMLRHRTALNSELGREPQVAACVLAAGSLAHCDHTGGTLLGRLDAVANAQRGAPQLTTDS
jgi:hypothetical protein